MNSKYIVSLEMNICILNFQWDSLLVVLCLSSSNLICTHIQLNNESVVFWTMWKLAWPNWIVMCRINTNPKRIFAITIHLKLKLRNWMDLTWQQNWWVQLKCVWSVTELINRTKIHRVQSQIPIKCLTWIHLFSISILIVNHRCIWKYFVEFWILNVPQWIEHWPWHKHKSKWQNSRPMAIPPPHANALCYQLLLFVSLTIPLYAQYSIIVGVKYQNFMLTPVAPNLFGDGHIYA